MKKHIFPISIIALTIIVWAIAYPKLPAEVPTHWGFNGEVNGYSSKLNAMLTQIGIMALLYFSVAFLPKIDPRRKNYKYFSSSYQMMYNALLVVFFGLNVFVIFYALGYDIPMSSLGTVFIGIIFIVLGNVMQRVRSNFFIGLRTPWALSNEEVWRKTHRFGGKLFFVSGIILLLATFLSGPVKEYLIIAIIAVIIVAPYIYSYLIYKKLS
ncbi:SdpI family protein [Bacillus marasmi]|uniref:SdpI family protein n=1 Tax=Bacillus marasmi TaxID=1926279 RepID=UPI0011C8CE13|nr:SdpI family protein [Bacillus marasmi]